MEAFSYVNLKELRNVPLIMQPQLDTLKKEAQIRKYKHFTHVRKSYELNRMKNG